MLKSAVTSLLLGCQTQKIALVFRGSPFIACERRLHDDGTHGSKSKPPGNKSLNKAPCSFTEGDADRDTVTTVVEQVINIISGRLTPNNVRTYTEIIRRIIILDRVGCTLAETLNDLDVLQLTEQEVLKRARILKGLGQSEILVDLLMIVGSKPADKVGRLLAQRETMIKFLCKVLDCSEPELEVLKQKHKRVKNLYLHSLEDLEEKVKLLQQYSISSRDMRDAPEILITRLSVIVARMALLHQLKEDGKLSFEKWPLNTIAAYTSIFNLRVKRALENRGEIDGSPLSYASIARCLGVTEKDICGVKHQHPKPSSFCSL